MARKGTPQRPGRLRRGAAGARRVWPYVLMVREWWERLSPEEKERYKARARSYAERGRQAYQARKRPRR
jgi:hypothetical protein